MEDNNERRGKKEEREELYPSLVMSNLKRDGSTPGAWYGVHYNMILDSYHATPCQNSIRRHKLTVETCASGIPTHMNGWCILLLHPHSSWLVHIDRPPSIHLWGFFLILLPSSRPPPLFVSVLFLNASLLEPTWWDGIPQWWHSTRGTPSLFRPPL